MSVPADRLDLACQRKVHAEIAVGLSHPTLSAQTVRAPVCSSLQDSSPSCLPYFRPRLLCCCPCLSSSSRHLSRRLLWSFDAPQSSLHWGSTLSCCPCGCRRPLCRPSQPHLSRRFLPPILPPACPDMEPVHPWHLPGMEASRRPNLPCCYRWRARHPACLQGPEGACAR